MVLSLTLSSPAPSFLPLGQHLSLLKPPHNQMNANAPPFRCEYPQRSGFLRIDRCSHRGLAHLLLSRTSHPPDSLSRLCHLQSATRASSAQSSSRTQLTTHQPPEREFILGVALRIPCRQLPIVFPPLAQLVNDDDLVRNLAGYAIGAEKICGGPEDIGLRSRRSASSPGRRASCHCTRRQCTPSRARCRRVLSALRLQHLAGDGLFFLLRIGAHPRVECRTLHMPCSADTGVVGVHTRLCSSFGEPYLGVAFG